MNFLKFVLVLVIGLFMSTIAMAQEVVAEPFFNMPEGMMSKVIMWVVAIQALAFGIGKGLTEISVLTENKYDNMVAMGFSKVAWMLGTVISRFGWGMPKQVVIQEAEKIKAKESK